MKHWLLYRWLRLRALWPRWHRVGRNTIRLSRGHALPLNQTFHRRYDVALGRIAERVHAKYPDMTALDVGANIGDSAALIRARHDIPVLCVEGDPHYLPLLRDNAARLGGVTVEACFVGTGAAAVAVTSIERSAGTSRIAAGATAAPGAPVVALRALAEILRAHGVEARTRLIKIDTDGHDFPIIEGALDYLAAFRPVLFFEFDPRFPGCSDAQAIACLRRLREIGYARFAVYANTGAYLLSGADPELFEDLCAFLAALRRHTRGDPAIQYFDLCAYAEADLDLWAAQRAEDLLA